MAERMRVRHDTVDYWDDLIRAASRDKTLTDAGLLRLAQRMERVRAGLYGRRLNESKKQEILDAAVKYLSFGGLTGRASKRGVITEAARQKSLQTRLAKVGAPWYWNLSSVGLKGKTRDGKFDKKDVNKAYRDGLVAAMKAFANQWAANGNAAPMHGFF